MKGSRGLNGANGTIGSCKEQWEARQGFINVMEWRRERGGARKRERERKNKYVEHGHYGQGSMKLRRKENTVSEKEQERKR